MTLERSLPFLEQQSQFLGETEDGPHPECLWTGRYAVARLISLELPVRAQ
jgi:hypothetical protein